jgi:hypothetical protein
MGDTLLTVDVSPRVKITIKKPFWRACLTDSHGIFVTKIMTKSLLKRKSKFFGSILGLAYCFNFNDQ